METELAEVKIVLVEPAGALNVGSVARVMKNMGLRHLVLVNPQCDPLGEEARLMAVHAADVLEAAIQVQTLPEALQGCQRSIATTGRDTTLNMVLESPRVALPWLLSGATGSSNALIFGREDHGLTNEELNYAQRLIQIPASVVYPSLNLAQAVAICCYELFVQALNWVEMPAQSPPEVQQAMSSPDLAPLDAREGYYQQLEALLLKIGYLYPHTAASRMEKFRRIFNRAYPSVEEVAMMRGIVRQMEWAMRTKARSTPES
ncbi:MAG TPA: RNA methyltransferase [Trichocoleus sp.]|jgi:tRNA/rRNA methyltransferase